MNLVRALRLSSLRPRSLSGLILLGFAAVALPLLLGTLSAAVEMRNLSAASERLVTNGVAATQYTQALVRQVASLERTARLYQILRRPSLLEVMRKNRVVLGTTLDGLEDLPGDPDRAAVINRMRTSAGAIEQGLGSTSTTAVNDALRQFNQLSRDAGQLSTLASRQTDRELNLLRAETESTRRRILWQSALLVPVTIGLMLLFTVFLARPIRQIDTAISDIGHGRLDTPVDVKGPTDLQALGRQLEWLRVRLGEISEERNRFLRHMSHELKTPLANIREGTELLLEGAVGGLNDEQREVTGILRENSLRLQRLIENLLSYSEWQARRGGLDVSEIKLQPLVTAAIEAYALPISAHHLALDQQVDDVSLEADRVEAEADPRQPGLERGEVHAGRRHDHRARAPRRNRPRSRRGRHGPRRIACRAHQDLRRVLPGRRVAQRARARHRDRFVGRAGVRPCAQRHDRDRGWGVPGGTFQGTAAVASREGEYGCPVMTGAAALARCAQRLRGAGRLGPTPSTKPRSRLFQDMISSARAKTSR